MRKSGLLTSAYNNLVILNADVFPYGSGMKWFIGFLLLASIALADDAGKSVQVKDALLVLKFGTIELTDKKGVTRKVERLSESAKPEVVRLREGESVRTLKDSKCTVVIPDAGTLLLDSNTSIKLPEVKEGKKATQSLELLGGKLFLDIDAKKLAGKKKEFQVKTPTIILAVKGTRFFAMTGADHETVGVHEGRVQLYEPTSKAVATIQSGRVALAKAGAITKPRAMTQEENEMKATYSEFALEFVDAEKRKRNFAAFYHLHDDHPASPRDAYHDFIDTNLSDKLDSGQAIKTVFKPIPNAPDALIQAFTEIFLSTRLRADPHGFYFYARGGDVRRFRIKGIVTHKEQVYEVLPSTYLDFPDDVSPDDWIPFYVPFVAGGKTTDDEYDNKELGRIRMFVNPFLHEKNAKKNRANVNHGKEEYTFEISPITLGLSVDPKD